MSHQLKLVILDGQKVLETITKETLDTHPSAMVKAINDFRLLVNTAMTKLIEDPNDTFTERKSIEMSRLTERTHDKFCCLLGDIVEEEEGDSDDDEKHIEVSPKKRKK